MRATSCLDIASPRVTPDHITHHISQVESQQHLLNCEKLNDNSLVADLHRYEDLYLEDADKVEAIGHILTEKFDQFKKFNPSAHNAITAEESPEDSDGNVRAAGGEHSSPVLLDIRRNWN